MKLTIENYQKLCDKGIPLKEIHREFGMSAEGLYYWRRENGFCRKLSITKASKNKGVQTI